MTSAFVGVRADVVRRHGWAFRDGEMDVQRPAGFIPAPSAGTGDGDQSLGLRIVIRNARLGTAVEIVTDLQRGYIQAMSGPSEVTARMRMLIPTLWERWSRRSPRS